MTSVAAPSLRIVRRPKGSAPEALTAASAPVTDPTQIFKTTRITGRHNWQEECWELLDLVGEFRFYVRFRSGACSRVKLVASEIGDDGLPTGGIADNNREGQRVAEIVRGIAGGPLGQAELIHRSAECLSVPGEHWVAILMRPQGQKWFAVTRQEIEYGTRHNTVNICLPDGEKHEFNLGKGDGMFRVWNPHPRKASEPDSPARAVLAPLREIVRTTKKISNADLSRLISAGLLFIPQEASLPPTQAPVSADKPGDPPADPTPQRPTANQLQDMIVKVASTAALEGENSMASLVPIVVAAPGDHLDKIKHLTFGDEVTKVALETRNDAISRLAMGLDMSPEQLLGLGISSNHWNAFLLADQDVQLHVAPVMQTFCQAVYDAVLRNQLESEGIDPAKYALWYDTSAITADPDKTDEAQAAWESGAIQVSAYLQMQGLPDDAAYDLSTAAGLQQWALDIISRKPELVATYAPLIAQLRGIEFPTPAQPAIGQAPNDQPPAQEPAPEDQPTTEGDKPNGQAAVGEHSRGELAVDLLVSRALELAGKRRRTRANYERLRGVPVQETHRVMGPVGREQIPELIKGWDTGLDELLGRYQLDPDVVRAAVRRHVQLELTREVIDVEVG